MLLGGSPEEDDAAPQGFFSGAIGGAASPVASGEFESFACQGSHPGIARPALTKRPLNAAVQAMAAEIAHRGPDQLVRDLQRYASRF